MRSAIALLSRAGTEGEGEAMIKPTPPSEHGVPVAISANLQDGSVVTGIMCMLPDRMGSFEVEYEGVRRTDGRSYDTGEAHMRSIARMLLQELAEQSKLRDGSD